MVHIDHTQLDIELCTALGRVLGRPGAQPRFGSVIERLFGTTNTEFIHTLRGNTQATQHPRLLTPAVDPTRQAIWSLADLYGYLCTWAYDVYDQAVHEALGTSPRD